MERQKRFAVIGSDARQLAAGRALARAGYAVEGPEEIALADYILLPLPLDAARTPLAELLRAARPGALALGGMLSEEAKAIAAEAGVELVLDPGCDLPSSPKPAPFYAQVGRRVTDANKKPRSGAARLTPGQICNFWWIDYFAALVAALATIAT